MYKYVVMFAHYSKIYLKQTRFYRAKLLPVCDENRIEELMEAFGRKCYHDLWGEETEDVFINEIILFCPTAIYCETHYKRKHYYLGKYNP